MFVGEKALRCSFYDQQTALDLFAHYPLEDDIVVKAIVIVLEDITKNFVAGFCQVSLPTTSSIRWKTMFKPNQKLTPKLLSVIN